MFEASIFVLVRRASSRESTRCVFVGSGSKLCARSKRRSSPVSRDVIGKCRNAIASRLLDRARIGGLSTETEFEADKAIQSSVRLRHILSALLFSWRSRVVEVLLIEAILAKLKASDVVASSARYISGVVVALALDSAELRSGWGVPSSKSFVVGESLVTPLIFGEEDIVVADVAAVRGLSILPLLDGGIFPVPSSFRILSLRSSSSSQTVDGAVVETADSVSSVDFGKTGDGS